MRIVKNTAALGFGGRRPIATGTLKNFQGLRREYPEFPWQGSFKNKEEVEEYFKGDKIICLMCGRSLRRLGYHLEHIHGMSVDRYKVRFELPWSRGLSSDDSVNKSSTSIKALEYKSDIVKKAFEASLTARKVIRPRTPPHYLKVVGVKHSLYELVAKSTDIQNLLKMDYGHH